MEEVLPGDQSLLEYGQSQEIFITFYKNLRGEDNRKNLNRISSELAKINLKHPGEKKKEDE